MCFILTLFRFSLSDSFVSKCEQGDLIRSDRREHITGFTKNPPVSSVMAIIR